MHGAWSAWFALAAVASPSSRLGQHAATSSSSSSSTTVDDGHNHHQQHKTLITDTNQPGRSNSTHVVWQDEGGEFVAWQSVHDARVDAYNYLKSNIMNFDLPFVETMGFHNDDRTEPDGLADGLVGTAIDLALQAKLDFAYTDRVPRAIWQEYVLNCANLNEARSSVRRLLRERLVEPLFLHPEIHSNSSTLDMDNENRSIAETVKILNTQMWHRLSHNSTGTIVFVAGQTPAIFDPMSVLAFGYASCTGLAVLMVEALRAAGVPARVVGTAAWNQDRNHGNHNWVEVWDHHQYGDTFNVDNNNKNNDDDDDMYQQCGWKFLEPSPAQSLVDTIDRNPCERWFCHPDRMANGTQVFAARLDTSAASASAHFPLAWEWGCHDVPAVNRTAYYQRVCYSCGGGDGGGDTV